jgi:hypothetical protein
MRLLFLAAATAVATAAAAAPASGRKNMLFFIADGASFFRLCVSVGGSMIRRFCRFGRRRRRRYTAATLLGIPSPARRCIAPPL